MKTWQVWMEGYRVTGNSNDASFKGEFEGETFQDAVKAYAETLDDQSKSYFDAAYTTFWGCRFFNNETDARKTFG